MALIEAFVCELEFWQQLIFFHCITLVQPNKGKHSTLHSKRVRQKITSGAGPCVQFRAVVWDGTFGQ